MQHRIYSISLTWPNPQSADLEAKLSSLGDDWIRLNFFQYFVWSARGRAALGQTVGEIMAPIGNPYFIVTVVHPEVATGSAPQWMWNWFNDRMQKQVAGL